jgi:MFS transporter, DHA1 family, multidrug resistance protein
VALNRWSPSRIVFAALATAFASGVVLIVLTMAGGGLIGFMVPLSVLLGALGFVLPNAPALALTRHGEAAGTAAALLGATQFALGALIAPLVGVLGNDGPAMALTMTVCAGLAWLALGATAWQSRRASVGQPVATD